MATTRTIDQVATEALERMGVTPVGTTPVTAHTTDMTRAYDELFLELQQDGLTTWASDAAVPSEYISVLADLMGLSRAQKFGTSAEKLNLIIAHVGVDGEKGKNKIRRLNANAKTTATVVAGNFF